MNRIGDFGFGLGVFACYAVFQTVEFEVIFATAPLYANQTFEFKPPSSGSSLSAYTQERHFGFRIKRNGSVELYNI